MAAAFTLEKRIEIVKKGEEYQKNDTPMAELYNEYSIAQPTYYKYRREIKKRLEKLGYNYDEIIISKNPEEIKNLILEGERKEMSEKKEKETEKKDTKIVSLDDTKKKETTKEKTKKEDTKEDDEDVIESILKEISSSETKSETKKEKNNDTTPETKEEKTSKNEKMKIPSWLWIVLGGGIIFAIVLFMNMRTNKEIKQLKTTMESKEQKKKSNDPFANYVTF